MLYLIGIPSHQRPERRIWCPSGRITNVPCSKQCEFNPKHQVHLHGHHFALLEQAYHPYDPKKLNLKLDNPPRRDVVLMPRSGYVVIAFKADNPGAWLVHCHIAFHISEGRGLQIMERQDDAKKLWPDGNSEALTEAARVCQKWETWHGNKTNWAVQNCTEKVEENCFQDDSGV